jgi:predicted  nucleic acid-binding Zn-ribbon protein
MYEHASEEIIKGCTCGSRLFYFVKSSEKKKNNNDTDTEDVEYFYEMEDEDAKEMIVFDIETINIKSEGKYELDIDTLMSPDIKKNNGLIYKYGDGKYSIDLDSSMRRVKRKG